IDSILTGIGVPQLTPFVALLLTLGGLGTLGAWIAGTARMPYSVGVDRYFPAALAKTHPRFGTPYISLIWLGIVSLGIMLIAIVGSTVKEFYLILANACLILYFIPYIYLFVSHIVYNLKNERKPLAVVLAICGIFSTVIAIVLTLIPPPETRPGHYLGNVVGGCVVFLAIGLIIYWVRRKQSKIPA
ncbi:amino acid permease, partial [bacterium]|nr:amino acid permease [bacterium]